MSVGWFVQRSAVGGMNDLKYDKATTSPHIRWLGSQLFVSLNCGLRAQPRCAMRMTGYDACKWKEHGV